MPPKIALKVPRLARGVADKQCAMVQCVSRTICDCEYTPTGH
jgi:hypothetical protein